MKIDYEKYPEFKDWLQVYDDKRLHSTNGGYVHWLQDLDYVTLDGGFSPEDLEALAKFMREHRK